MRQGRCGNKSRVQSDRKKWIHVSHGRPWSTLMRAISSNHPAMARQTRCVQGCQGRERLAALSVTVAALFRTVTGRKRLLKLSQTMDQRGWTVAKNGAQNAQKTSTRSQGGSPGMSQGNVFCSRLEEVQGWQRCRKAKRSTTCRWRVSARWQAMTHCKATIVAGSGARDHVAPQYMFRAGVLALKSTHSNDICCLPSWNCVPRVVQNYRRRSRVSSSPGW